MKKRLHLAGWCCLLAFGACGGTTLRSSDGSAGAGAGAGGVTTPHSPGNDGGSARPTPTSAGAGGNENATAGAPSTGGVQDGSGPVGGADAGAAAPVAGGAGGVSGATEEKGGESGNAGAEAGAGGAGGEPATCRDWPPGCSIGCDEPVGACLQDAQGQVPYGTASLALQVTATASAEPPRWSWRCIGRPFSSSTTLLATDGAGKTWSLVLAGSKLPPQQFPIGSALAVEWQLFFETQFEPTRALTIRQDGQVVAHFEDGPRDATIPAELGIEVTTGEQACPWSLPDDTGCSATSLHTLGRHADITVLDPCNSPLGPFSVSSTFRGGRHVDECGGIWGGCDAADQFLLGIVRLPPTPP